MDATHPIGPPVFRRVLLNGILWSLDRPTPGADHRPGGGIALTTDPVRAIERISNEEEKEPHFGAIQRFVTSTFAPILSSALLPENGGLPVRM